MKQFYKLTTLTLIALSALLLSCGTGKSAAEKAARAKFMDKQIENTNFEFVANHAYPQGYQSIHLTSQYSVKVTPDTVKAYLPYFGRAYRAPMNSSEGGIKFESTNFESKVLMGKRQGEWHVTINTKDTPSPITLNFHLWNNGTGQLKVTHQDRQSISFQGEIKEHDY